MKKTLAYAILLSSSLYIMTPAFSNTKYQNSKDAIKFFDNELNFKINPYGVKSAIENKENIVIVDVRKKEDFDRGHIPHAINIPFDKFNSFEGQESSFQDLKNNSMHLVYCYESGCNLAAKACKKFAQLGYAVKEIQGGYAKWKNDNFEIEKN